MAFDRLCLSLRLKLWKASYLLVRELNSMNMKTSQFYPSHVSVEANRVRGDWGGREIWNAKCFVFLFEATLYEKIKYLSLCH